MNEGARARDPACVSLLRRLRVRRLDAAWLYTHGVLQALARAQILRMGRDAVGGPSMRSAPRDPSSVAWPRWIIHYSEDNPPGFPPEHQVTREGSSQAWENKLDWACWEPSSTPQSTSKYKCCWENGKYISDDHSLWPCCYYALCSLKRASTGLA